MDNICNGFTKSGIKCTKRTKDKKYCYLHKDQELVIRLNLSKIKLVNNIIGDCSICFENILKIDDSELECKHIFHINCIKKLRDNRCPVCRSDLKSDKLSDKDITTLIHRKENDRRNNNDIIPDINDIGDYIPDIITEEMIIIDMIYRLNDLGIPIASMTYLDIISNLYS